MERPIVRMSQAGHCPRQLSATLLGYEAKPPSPALEMAAQEGKWHEERLIKELEDEGANVYDRQLEVTIELPNLLLVGHIEGMIASTDDCRDILLEIKSMSQYEFDRWMKGRFNEFPNYAAQISCYMEATGLETCFYIVKNRNSGYVDRMIFNEKPVSIEAIKDRLTAVVASVQAYELASADFDPSSLECRRCSYRELCIPKPEDIPLATQGELLEAVGRVREGRGLLAQGESLFESGKEVLQAYAVKKGLQKWTFERLVMTQINVRRESYEKKKLLETFSIEQLAPALTISEYTQFKIVDLEERQCLE